MGLVADHIWFPNTSRPCFGGYTLVFFVVLDTVEQSTDKQYKGLPSRGCAYNVQNERKAGHRQGATVIYKITCTMFFHHNNVKIDNDDRLFMDLPCAFQNLT
jgi:hypothetical protein